MHPIPHIPPSIEISAHATMKSMSDRGFSAPNLITVTCHQIASVMLAKADTADKKAIRILTNRLISAAYDDVTIDAKGEHSETPVAPLH